MNTLKALASGSSLIAMLAAAATPTMSLGETLAEIEAAAKAEGMLTTIALPHDWCGYGAVIEGFKKKYPEIAINELNPDGSSADELEAVRANKGNTGPQAPDVLEFLNSNPDLARRFEQAIDLTDRALGTQALSIDI